LYVRPQAWWTPIGLLAVIGPSRNDHFGFPAFWAFSRSKDPLLLPEAQDFVLAGDELGFVNALEHGGVSMRNLRFRCGLVAEFGRTLPSG
jgi:hypothetical protein